MNVIPRIRSAWRPIFKATVIYAASAWAIIQVIDFAVERYGLSRLLLDSAVLVAFGGGMVTAVLAWFHGSPGSQKAKPSEIAIIVTVSLATAFGVAFLALRDPTAAFNDLDGYRLTFEFLSEGPGNEQYLFSTGPWESTEVFESGMYHLEPVEGTVDGPGVKIRSKKHPVMLLAPSDSELMTVRFVLPFEPIEVANILESGRIHDGLNFTTKNLSVAIENRVEISGDTSGTTIRIP